MRNYEIKTDLHTHTLASTHAYSTLEENCRGAFANGLEGINIQVLVRSDGHAVLFSPAPHDLLVTGTVDLTLVAGSQRAALVNDRLLLRCQIIVNLLVDAEEQTVIVCIP